VSVVTWSPTPLDGALLLAHWLVRQKLNHVSSVQFSSVQLRRSVRALRKLMESRRLRAKQITQSWA